MEGVTARPRSTDHVHVGTLDISTDSSFLSYARQVYFGGHRMYAHASKANEVR